MSEVPKAPRGTGISRRLLVSMFVLIFLIAILFLYFLNNYAPKNEPLSVNNLSSAMDIENTAEVINEIEENPQRKLSEKSTKKNIKINKANASLDNPENKDDALTLSDFNDAGNAPINVYHYESSEQNIHQDKDRESLPVNNALPNQYNPSQNSYDEQNMQSEKIAFLKSSSQTNNDYLSSELKPPISPYELKAGTLIPATLLTATNSDLPGNIVAKVSENVFDTATGNYLLVPQGTTLLGVYDSQIAYGQSRLLIAWNRMIFPNSESMDLENMPGVDLIGMAGLHDLVDSHHAKIFGSALMFSIFGALGQLSQPMTSTDQLSTQQIIYGAIGQQMSQTAMQLVAKNMDIQPTIMIRPGTNFNVLVTKDIVIPNYYNRKIYKLALSSTECDKLKKLVASGLFMNVRENPFIYKLSRI